MNNNITNSVKQVGMTQNTNYQEIKKKGEKAPVFTLQIQEELRAKMAPKPTVTTPAPAPAPKVQQTVVSYTPPVQKPAPAAIPVQQPQKPTPSPVEKREVVVEKKPVSDPTFTPRFDHGNFEFRQKEIDRDNETIVLGLSRYALKNIFGNYADYKPYSMVFEGLFYKPKSNGVKEGEIDLNYALDALISNSSFHNFETRKKTMDKLVPKLVLELFYSNRENVRVVSLAVLKLMVQEKTLSNHALELIAGEVSKFANDPSGRFNKEFKSSAHQANYEAFGTASRSVKKLLQFGVEVKSYSHMRPTKDANQQSSVIKAKKAVEEFIAKIKIAKSLNIKFTGAQDQLAKALFKTQIRRSAEERKLFDDNQGNDLLPSAEAAIGSSDYKLKTVASYIVAPKTLDETQRLLKKAAAQSQESRSMDALKVLLPVVKGYVMPKLNEKKQPEPVVVAPAPTPAPKQEEPVVEKTEVVEVPQPLTERKVEDKTPVTTEVSAPEEVIEEAKAEVVVQKAKSSWSPACCGSILVLIVAAFIAAYLSQMERDVA